jgi:hypothetical protein
MLRPIARSYALSALGYLVILAYFVYATEPFRFGWATKPPGYGEMLFAFCAPLGVSACSAALLLHASGASSRVRSLVLGMSVFLCTALLVRGWGLFILPLAPPTLLLVFRTYRMRP